MKNYYLQLILFLFLINNSNAQNVIIKGKVKCLNNTIISTKGAENVVVVPTFVPSQSTLTVSRPAGFFEFNTGMPLSTLEDKQVQLHLLYRCGNECDKTVIRAFISEDQDRQNRDDNKRYVTVRDWTVKQNCQVVELPGRKADSLLAVIIKQPGTPISDISNVSALTGTPALLNVLTNLTTVLGSIGQFGPKQVLALQPGEITYGNFLLASPMFHSANTGFNFSPGRDYSEAVFWNPSAMVNSRKKNNVSLLTNVKNNNKLSGFTRLNDRFSVGAGVIYTLQDEFRTATFEDIGDYDSVALKLHEFAVYASGAYQVNKKLSVGVAAKSTWQNFTIPTFIDIKSGFTDFYDSTIKKQVFDVDVSATYVINPSFQVGINVMNIAGSELYADAFVPQAQNFMYTNQRSLGIGLLYKNRRWNAGLDVLVTEDDLYDVALGVNYVPFNEALISAGIAFKQLSYSVSFRLKHFRLAYIEDNGYLVNEKRQGKIFLLNGKLHGGFVFDF